MSGGYFNYEQFRLLDIINTIEVRDERIKELDEDAFDDVTEDLIQDAKVLAQLTMIFIHRVDWLLSGDDGPDVFKERIDKDLIKKGFLSYGTNSISFPGKKVYAFTKKIEE